jgi:PHD/YefM family antitoxin component YafN of YafNO toxin-antitoxin module
MTPDSGIIVATISNPRAKMKIASVKEVKDRLSQFLKTAEKEDIVITKNGRPNAVLHHLGEDEIEDYLLEHDPKFRRKIERRWRQYLQKGGRSVKEILRGL